MGGRSPPPRPSPRPAPLCRRRRHGEVRPVLSRPARYSPARRGSPRLPGPSPGPARRGGARRCGGCRCSHCVRSRRPRPPQPRASLPTPPTPLGGRSATPGRVKRGRGQPGSGGRCPPACTPLRQSRGPRRAERGGAAGGPGTASPAAGLPRPRQQLREQSSGGQPRAPLAPLGSSQRKHGVPCTGTLTSTQQQENQFPDFMMILQNFSETITGNVHVPALEEKTKQPCLMPSETTLRNEPQVKVRQGRNSFKIMSFILKC
ncbi:translation initiation factor IF-2-like [Strigops habroptila]|uniref:translation initiation factor IF-2-like n=1 Tax=Strigops habroptila TaxID=2489341 RepID=UPI0011CF06E0|nr:translation initiation factor IF-2-like [Strigops habroptila]